MAFPSVRFVDAPDESAVVRLDLNGVGGSVDVASLHDEFSLGMASLDGEAGRRGRRWGLRTLPLPLMLSGGRSAARAAMTSLAREVTRDGWVRWQLDAATPPVWFRTYATAPSSAGFDMIRKDATRDRWLTTLGLSADPFGVGAPITLGPYTVSNHPASGTHPMRVTLPEVVGEMPAPAMVRVTRADGRMLGPAVAAMPHDLAMVTAANWTSVVTAAVSNSQFIGGSYRQTNGTITTGGWWNVCTFTPSVSMPMGRRRALLRVSGSQNAGALLLRWVAASPAALSQVTSDPVLVRSGLNTIRWVDTGLVPYPLADGAALGVAPTTVYTLQARRAAPGGELLFDDRLLLLPTEGTTMQIAAPGDVGGAAADVLFDAEQRRLVMTAGGNLVRSPATRGGWPTLRPGQPNVLFVAQTLDPDLLTGVNDGHSFTTAVTVTYRPRSLWGIG